MHLIFVFRPYEVVTPNNNRGPPPLFVCGLNILETFLSFS